MTKTISAVPRLRCNGCENSTRWMSDIEAELVETHELCSGCRTSDLAARIAFIRSEIRDLVRDAEPAASRGLLPAVTEAEINRLAEVVR